MDKESDTQRVSRMLVLWLELQAAMRELTPTRSTKSSAMPQPWEHRDTRVRAVWNQITDPQNERALMEWLLAVGSDQDEAWTHEAIRECHRRRKQG